MLGGSCRCQATENTSCCSAQTFETGMGFLGVNLEPYVLGLLPWERYSKGITAGCPEGLSQGVWSWPLWYSL